MLAIPLGSRCGIRDPRWVAEVGPLLYRAQVYTFFETKNRGLVKKALDALVKI